MTDAEKMLEMMTMMGAAVKGEAKTQFNTAAEMTKMMYDSYVDAGFSSKMALELTKTMLIAAIQTGKK